MKINFRKKSVQIVSFVFAFLSAVLCMSAVFSASIYGTDYLTSNSIKGGYVVFMLFSILFLMVEYIFFGRKDSRKMIVVRLVVHNIFGGAVLLLSRFAYSALNLENKCLYSAEDVLKNIFVKKWVSYILITIVSAVICYLFSSDKTEEKNEKRNRK